MLNPQWLVWGVGLSPVCCVCVPCKSVLPFALSCLTPSLESRAGTSSWKLLDAGMGKAPSGRAGSAHSAREEQGRGWGTSLVPLSGAEEPVLGCCVVEVALASAQAVTFCHQRSEQEAKPSLEGKDSVSAQSQPASGGAKSHPGSTLPVGSTHAAPLPHKITLFSPKFLIFPPKPANPAYGTPENGGAVGCCTSLRVVGCSQLILSSCRNVSKSNQEIRLSAGNKPPGEGEEGGRLPPRGTGSCCATLRCKDPFARSEPQDLAFPS